MNFGKAQEARFSTEKGAYSLVTEREYYDSQITLTDFESQLLIDFFGRENIHVGNVSSDPHSASKTFHLYPQGQKIQLNLVFPKPEKSELRLYLSQKAGFKPEGGQIWFIFNKDNALWIGSMAEANWRFESSILKDDFSDYIYQESLDEHNEIRVTKLKERDTFARDRSVALKKMEISGYRCEFDSNHDLFISRYSGMPYLEAHHLIPMGLQASFNNSLDTVHNVFCLCPQCHRAVHHAEADLTRDILDVLVHKGTILDKFNLSIDDLFSYYSVEKIL